MSAKTDLCRVHQYSWCSGHASPNMTTQKVAPLPLFEEKKIFLYFMIKKLSCHGKTRNSKQRQSVLNFMK
jgi:hypothetical protein